MEELDLTQNKQKMRTTGILIFCMLISTLGFAQNDYKASLDGWLVNIDKAYEVSQKTGKPILANFTGTDWCIWCKRLQRDVFVKDGFDEWAEENVVLLELDFPRRSQVPKEIKQQNAKLQQSFKVRGYPTIWVFDLGKDESGEFQITPLGRTGYTKTLDKFTSDVEKMIDKRQAGTN